MIRQVLFIGLFVLLAACAPGGIGVEALVQDKTCHQAAYAVGTQNYAQCRERLHRQAGSQPGPRAVRSAAILSPQ